MKSNSPAPVQHHGEILSIQNVADCRGLASRYRPNLVVPSHIHDRACIGFIVDGQCEETFSNHVTDLRQHELFFRPAGFAGRHRPVGKQVFPDRGISSYRPNPVIQGIEMIAAKPSFDVVPASI